MRTLTGRLLLLAILLFPCATLFAESPAPLGTILARRYAEMGPGESAVVLVYFKDKGPSGKMELHSAAGLLSPRSIARRERVRGRGNAVTDQDLPVDGSYVAEISGMVVRARHALRWFNAVSVEATKEQIDALRRLSYVREIELVGRWKGTPEPELPPSKSDEDALFETQAHLLNYGSSLTQNNQIGVTNVHDLGIFGEGVLVGVFDDGFRLLAHEAFDSMDIIATYDFVDNKVSVVPNVSSLGTHGINTLSTIGGFKPGQLIGPAFRAKYVLARTENTYLNTETPVEEDNWAAAIEWADSIGIDVASTSLGYLTYDAPYTSWTYLDMNGNTTVITRAADYAVSVGIVVVNSAGNGGPGNGTDNTLGAPSDGDSVIAAGAVTSTGLRSSFSSVGPTTDVPARIKPDVMAMGTGVRVANSSVTTQYGSANGTSFSCPLTAGVAALILSANPSLTPMQVRDAMRNTANNAATPNNQYGWGILDADSAIRSAGIIPMAKLTGTAFHDLNGNGVRDGGEPALSGEQVVVSGASSDTAVSAAGGEFLFDSLFPGATAVSAAPNSGWMVTTPAESLDAQLLHRDSLGGFEVGLFQTGAVSGTVYFDANENGTRDTLETPLDAWTVILSGPVTDTAFSNLAGVFNFSGLPPGAYAISQVPQPEWLQSAPPTYGAHAFTVSSGFDSAGLDFGNFYSETSAFSVSAGWNLLSLPVAMLNALADSIYPNALSSVSLYDAGYYSTDTLPNGKGYWVKFAAPQNILIAGLERTIDTVEVAQGWNLVGGLSVPVLVSMVMQEPGGIVASKFFAFENNTYVGLEIDGTFLPHRGYWVKCSAAGVLILDSTPPGR